MERNLAAFQQGRNHYLNPSPVPANPAGEKADYVRELTAYQNAAYARKFTEFVSTVPEQYRETVERNLFKLMMVKDEYEVARLLTKPSFLKQLDEQWEAIESVRYNLHPPLLRRLGLKRKIQIGGWFGVLKHLKFLRGTPFDLFGFSRHRRLERSLIPWYKDLVARSPELAALPEQIRGYEGIKESAIARAREAAKVTKESSLA